MDPTQSSHLQFQISLLRLMDQKWMEQNSGSQVGAPVPVPSAQVMELAQLQHSGPAGVQAKTQS